MSDKTTNVKALSHPKAHHPRMEGMNDVKQTSQQGGPTGAKGAPDEE